MEIEEFYDFGPWENALNSLKNKRIYVLEIGSSQGSTTSWILNELFHNPDSKLFVLVFKNENQNLRKKIDETRKRDQIEIINSDNNNGPFEKLIGNDIDITFDFIYVNEKFVLTDAMDLLKVGGIMIINKKVVVQQYITKFLQYKNYTIIEDNSNQLVLQN